MAIRVSLPEIIEAMEWQSDEMGAYLDLRTGRVAAVSSDDLEDAELDTELDDPDVSEELAIARGVAAGDDYLALPDRFEIDEYRMMARFAGGVADAEASGRLSRAIRGPGAFRYFKDTVHDLGLAEDWYAYRAEAYEAIAIAWFEAHDLAYTRDRPAPDDQA